MPYSILAATGVGIPSSITDRSRRAGAPDVSWSSQSVITIGDPFRKAIFLPMQASSATLARVTKP
ncbi:MAG: hypothetical protein OXG19_02200 [Chloroflexi bacterium]|nr:hypothetical protein [Chloroflexota bacterium]